MPKIATSIIIAAIIIGFSSYQYKKGTFLKAFATIIIVICANAAAFNYFETLANVFINYGTKPKYPVMLGWAQMLCFVLIFILAFAIMQTILIQLTKVPTNFGVLAEKVGRIVCGLISGILLAGMFLTAVDMAPVSVKYPYGRFDEIYADIENPSKALLNVDGFAAGWFSFISNGSFKSQRSFAALHPNFINEIYLNRLGINNEIPVVAKEWLIVLPKKDIMTTIEETLKQANDPNKTIKVIAGHKLTSIKIGIEKKIIEQPSTFTFSQIKLVCKPKGQQENIATGKSKAVYPIGYLKTKTLVETKELSDRMIITPEDFGDENIKWFDFIFQVPTNYTPVLIGFRQNKIDLLPQSKSTGEKQEQPSHEPSEN